MENSIQDEHILLSAPRGFTWNFILCVSTLNLISMVWLYKAAKDLLVLTGKPIKPGLWAVMPIIPIAQPFALYNLHQLLKEEEKKYGIKTNVVTYAVASVAVFVAALVTNFDIPDIAFVVLILVVASGYCLIIGRINALRSVVPGAIYTGKLSGYTIKEVVLLVVCLPIFCLGVASMVYMSALVNEIEKMPDSTQFIDEQQNFAITFHGDKWRQVEVGTFSDGSALVEFTQYLSDSYFVVFETSRHEGDLNTLLSNRIADFYELNSGLTCQTNKELISQSNNVVIYTNCKDMKSVFPEVYLSTVFMKGDRVFELYGQLFGTKQEVESRLHNYLSMAEEFSPR